MRWSFRSRTRSPDWIFRDATALPFRAFPEILSARQAPASSNEIGDTRATIGEGTARKAANSVAGQRAAPGRRPEPQPGAPKEPKRYKASKEELLDFYKQMLLIRRFEERAGQLYGLGLIGGFCHLYIGQEAVAVGLQSAMKVGRDSVITGYRDHGHMLAYGIDPKVIMAELTGRDAGISKGKGGSMHMFSVEHGFYGGHGIVGAQVALGTGLAFKHQYAEGRRHLPRLFRRRRGQPGPGL